MSSGDGFFTVAGDAVGSFFEHQPPATVYQTSLVDNCKQDGSTPLSLTVRVGARSAAALTAAVHKGTPLSSLVHVALRRCVCDRCRRVCPP